MRIRFIAARVVAILFLLSCVLAAEGQSLNLRVLSSNLSSGNGQAYETPGLNILQGLHPDVVAIQEFNFSDNSPAELRRMIDQTFGTTYSYFRETNSGYQIPNGIISRYPIVAAGSWDDPLIPNRGFAWGQIQLPGGNDLYVVSVHLYSTGTATDRNTEASLIKDLVQTNFPSGAWVIVAGDFNTSTRGEAAVTTFKTFLSDDAIPVDTAGDPDTNAGRGNPYDYVLPSFALASYLAPVVLASHSFSNGLVFDSRTYLPLSDVPPVTAGDSGVSGMQHMAVVKDFVLPLTTSSAPSISAQPQSITVSQSQDAFFQVTANGTAPLNYQWRFNGTNIGGAVTNTYTRFSAQPNDAGPYTVVVSNSSGSVTSSPAILTVVTQQSAVIAQWTFNSSPPDASTATGTLSPALGAGTAAGVGGVSQTFAGGSPVDPDAAGNDNSGWNTSTYPASNVGSKTAGVRFNVSTAGRQNISIRWDQRASNTGSKYARLQYTTNGNDFVDFPNAVSVVALNFESKTNNLTGIPGVNNNPNFAFRIVAEFESTAAGTANPFYVPAGTGSYAPGGTIRFDMVTVTGSAISATNPPAAAAALSGAGYGAGEFHFNVTGTATSNYAVQATTNLATGPWIALRTNASPYLFIDTNAGNFSRRFYRALTQ